MTNELTTQEKFEYIVEDPFYSSIHQCEVRVDDYGNMWCHGQIHFEGLTDGMIDVLFTEWTKYQKFLDRINEVGVNTLDLDELPNIKELNL